MSRWPAPSLRHVARLTVNGIGIVEHARHADPRPELGCCTDDAGRALALACRLPTDPDAHRIATAALAFLTRAALGDGGFRLRCRIDGRWTADAPSDDATGRALLGLGTAGAGAPWPEVRARAMELFDAGATFRSPHPRARAYAALGAVELLAAQPRHRGAAELVMAADLLGPVDAESPWPWPAPRLTYANALLPEGALAVAVAAGGDGGDGGDGVETSLSILDWLVAEETRDGWFSFTPIGGRGPGDRGPGFDQQPIEAWAMADACARAYRVTGDPRWAAAVERAAGWFLGDNDRRLVMFDPVSGGGFDGLEAAGVNRNQGAESTLAFVATMAQVRSLRRCGQAASPAFAAARASSR
jgi:hypothetical protein